MTEEVSPPDVLEPIDNQSGLHRTSDPEVAEAVAAYVRLQQEVDRQERDDLQLRPPLSQLPTLPPQQSSELAVPAAHNTVVSPEEQAAVRKEYARLTTGILESVKERVDTPRAGRVLGAALGKGPTRRVVKVIPGPPEVRRAMPDVLPVTEIFGPGWITDPTVKPDAIPVDEQPGVYRSQQASADLSRTMCEAFLGEGEKVVVHITAGTVEGTTYTAGDIVGRRDANLGDMDRLASLFGEVERAHSGTPAAEIQPGYTPLTYTHPKAIGPAQE